MHAAEWIRGLRRAAAGLFVAGLLAVLAGVPAPAWAAAAQADVEDDNFESYADGTAAASAGWDTVDAGFAGAEVDDEADSGVATADGTQMVVFNGGQTNDVATRTFAAQAGDVVFECLIRMSEDDTDIGLVLEQAGGADVMELQFEGGTANILVSADDVLTDTGANWAINTWYRVRMEYDRSAATYDVFIDNVLVADDFGDDSTGDPAQLRFSMTNDNDDQLVYLDDIEVYTQRKWIGTTSTAWNTTTNWSMAGEGVPDVAETVRFTDGDLVANQPLLDSGRSVAGVMIDDDDYGPNNTSIGLNGQTLTNAGTLDIDAGGTLAVGSGTITVAGATDLNGTLTISTGLCDANGAWDGTGGTVTFTGAGDLKLAGAVTALADGDATFTASTGEVTYDGAADQTVDNLTYYDLTLHDPAVGATVKSLSGTTIVGHNLQVSTAAGTATLDLAGQTLDLDNSGTNNVDSGCVLEVDAGASLRFETTASLSIDDGGTLRIQGTDMDTNVATVTTSGVVGTHGYTLDINGGADIDYAIFQSLDVATAGITLDDATAGESHDMDFVSFASEVDAVGAWISITGSQWNGVTINTIALEAGPATSISKTVAGADTNVVDYAEFWPINGYIGPAEENDTNGNLVWSLDTAVELVDFHAAGYDGGVALFWQTASEQDNLGFNILRKEEGAPGGYAQINPGLVMGLGNSVTGGRYYFLDETAGEGKAYAYFLEDVELGGNRKLHGPVTGARAPGTALDLTQGGTVDPDGYAAHGATSDPPPGGDGGSGGGGAPPPRLADLLSGDEIRILGRKLSRDGRDMDVVVEITPPDAPLELVMVDGELHLRIELPGWPSVWVPGRPEVPEKTFFLDLPRAERVEVDLLEGRSRHTVIPVVDVLPSPAPEKRKMMRAELEACLEAARRPPGPRSRDERRLDFRRDGESQARHARRKHPKGDDYWDPRFYPRETAAFGGYYPIGGEDLLALTAHPVQVATQGRLLRRYSRIVARIRLTGIVAVPPPPSEEIRINPAAQRESWKVVCTEEGLHRLTYEALGWVAPAASAKLALMYDGTEMAIEVSDGGDGTFGPGDSLVFFARSLRDGPYGPYTDEAAYWLLVRGAGEADGLRMLPAALPPTGTPTNQQDFPRSVRWEQDNFENANIANGEARDNAFWAIAFLELIGPPVEGTLEAVSTVPGQGKVRIALQGLTYDDDVAPDHHAIVSLNGTQIAEMHFDGPTLKETEVVVDQGLFHEGLNTFGFLMPQDTGADFDAVYVERIDLTYRRAYAASGGKLLFSTQLGGDYTVPGFAGDEVRLYDITDPGLPKAVQGHEAVGGNLVFGTAAGARRFAAAEPAAFLGPVRVEYNAPTGLGVKGQRADYLLITHGSFLAEAERLAAHRRSLGLTVLVADVQDVYDEFSGGHFTPNAIRDFLRFAWRGYAAPAPQYCLLMGDAAFRYRTLPGGPVTYVPTKIALLDSGGMEAPSDNLLADVEGADAVPEIYLGRFPVSTPGEADAMVDKVIAYETSGDNGTGFTGRVTHIAGDGNGGPAFETTLDALVAQLPSSIQSNAIRMHALGEGPGTQAIRDALDQGSVMATYLGHGAVDLWGSDAGGVYLWAGDAAALGNGAAQYFLCTYNCLNGFYTLDDPLSLGEAMAKAPSRAAIAVWASAALTPFDHQKVLAVELERLVFQEGVRRIGKATSLAKILAAANPHYKDLANTWILFGDPALTLKIQQ